MDHNTCTAGEHQASGMPTRQPRAAGLLKQAGSDAERGPPRPRTPGSKRGRSPSPPQMPPLLPKRSDPSFTNPLLAIQARGHACKLCLSHLKDRLSVRLCLSSADAVMHMACKELPHCRVGGGYEYVSPEDRSSLLMEHSTYTTYRSLPANQEPYSDYDLVSIGPAAAALL